MRVNVFSRRLCMVANRFDARTPNPKTYPGITGSRMCEGWWRHGRCGWWRYGRDVVRAPVTPPVTPGSLDPGHDDAGHLCRDAHAPPRDGRRRRVAARRPDRRVRRRRGPRRRVGAAARLPRHGGGAHLRRADGPRRAGAAAAGGQLRAPVAEVGDARGQPGAAAAAAARPAAAPDRRRRWTPSGSSTWRCRGSSTRCATCTPTTCCRRRSPG